MNSISRFLSCFVNRSSLPFYLSGLALAGSSVFPETAHGLLCAVLTALFFRLGLERSETPLQHGFLSGFVFTALAFYWLPDTLSLFGGFPSFVSLALFSLFCASSALQFLIVAWLWRRLKGSTLDLLCLSFPLAWLFSELLYPRLFPWAIGHALVAWPEFAALGSYVGVPLCSVLVLWWGSSVVRLLFVPTSRSKPTLVLLLLAVSTLLFAVGKHRMNTLDRRIAEAPTLNVALIQGNIDVLGKNDSRLKTANIDRYRALTASATEAGAELVLWPESVSSFWTPEAIASVRRTRFDPYPPGGVALLYGGLSYRERDKADYLKFLADNPSFDTPRWREQLRFHRFNSVFGVAETGAVRGMYHKRVLMPFGEYVPFSSAFPILKTFLPQTGDFSFGDLDEPISFPGLTRAAPNGETLVPRIASLICYEDLIPSLAREAVEKGAHLLVNQTNDAWYGDTAEPYQHHLLAQWRAIESGRSLLRVTNTGFTAVVDPHGRTQESLPIYEEGYLLAEVPLMGGETVYATWGDIPAWILSGLTLLLALFRPKGVS